LYCSKQTAHSNSFPKLSAKDEALAMWEFFNCEKAIAKKYELAVGEPVELQTLRNTKVQL